MLPGPHPGEMIMVAMIDWPPWMCQEQRWLVPCLHLHICSHSQSVSIASFYKEGRWGSA